LIHKLERSDFEKVRPLVRQVPLACAVDATLDGTCPGDVWVDDPVDPTAAVVDTPEGHYVLGNARDGSFARSLAEFVKATLGPGGRGEGWWWFYLRCPSEDWAEAMRKVLPVDRTAEKPREFYVCEDVSFDWQGNIPAGFEFVRVDEQFLARDDLVNIDPIRRRARSNFGSFEGFLEKGFAFCMLHDNEIVSDCAADNVSARRCEVGAHTLEGYRKRGLGTLTVAATTDWALSNGFDQVGWHCLRYNVASAATARRVGFRKAADYTAFLTCAKPADAYAVKGNLCLIRREFAKAAEWYEMAIRAVASAGGEASNLLRRPVGRAMYLFQAACAHALAGQRESGIEMLAAGIEVAGYRQGGY
jgi:RimJ/RimL family protein N-acetyltransferase